MARILEFARQQQTPSYHPESCWGGKEAGKEQKEKKK